MRLLGGNERTLWRYSQVHSFNFTTIGRISGPLEPSSVQRALDAVQARHPLLRVHISPSERPAYERAGVPAIPLRVVERQGPEHWQWEAQEELDTPLPWQQGPLVRAVLLRGDTQHEILLTLHHANGDGYSGVYLMRDMVAAAASVLEGRPLDLAPLPSRPSIETLLPADACGARGLLRVLKMVAGLVRSVVGLKVRRLPGGKEVVPTRRRSRLVHVEFPPDVTARVLERCRAEGTSVHGALCAALMKAASAHIQRHEGTTASVGVGCFTPVNVRELLEPQVTLDEVGLYVAGPSIFLRIGAHSPFWAVAREARQQVQDMKRSGDVCVAIQLRNLVAPRKEVSAALVARVAGSPLLGTVGVTNLTRLNLSTRYGPLMLERLHFALATNGLGNLPVLAVATLEGRMQLNLTYTASLVAEALIHSLLEQTLSALLMESGAGSVQDVVTTA